MFNNSNNGYISIYFLAPVYEGLSMANKFLRIMQHRNRHETIVILDRIGGKGGVEEWRSHLFAHACYIFTVKTILLEPQPSALSL